MNNNILFYVLGVLVLVVISMIIFAPNMLLISNCLEKSVDNVTVEVCSYPNDNRS